MNYGEVRDRSLQLMRQYSLAGDPIERDYNNQADYLKAIPGLVDEAMMEIANIRYIDEYKELRLDPTIDRLGMPTYLLPDDLMDIMPGGFLVVEPGAETPSYDTGWAQPDERHIIFPKRGKHFRGRVFLQYYRRPHSIMDCMKDGCPLYGGECTAEAPSDVEPPDCAPLDNDPSTHTAIPYYVAAHLLLGEDSFGYASLYNEWVAKLGRMQKAPQPHRHIISDVYGMENMYDWGDC